MWMCPESPGYFKVIKEVEACRIQDKNWQALTSSPC